MATRVLSLLLVALEIALGTDKAHATMHTSERRHLRDQARAMFYHGYTNYMEHAFPWDELKPLSCEGRRWDRRERGDLDDVLGGYALTLIDSLDMLAILGDRDEFRRAVGLVIDTVDFDRDVTVSVFESTIRVIGGLISAHLIASTDHLGVLTPDEYNGELLDLAVDLGHRLLPAFDTPTLLPVHRVNLRHGMATNAPAITCPAAAGSLLVEFAYLSRLSGIAVFEEKARDAVVALWRRRSDLNLLGSSIDVFSGEWQTSHVGIGAGLDSFFEYLLKYHLVSGNTRWLEMFNMSYSAVETHMNHNDFHLEVDMHYGREAVRFQRVSALQAFWPGLQVLAGDVSSAMRSHDKLFLLWNKFGAMPELFDLGADGGVISWARTSPLRPELIESTYHLYQATRDHKYLKIGRKLLEDIERVSRVACGYAAVGNIHTLAVEDRMDSYFLSETVKYLYLLFSDDPDTIVPAMALPSSTNSSVAVNTSMSNTTQFSRALKSSEVVFSTEGHVLHVDASIFERNASSSRAKAANLGFWCQNGNALVQTEKQRQKQAAPAATKASANKKTALTFVPIGVSVRVGDAHITTAVASPATFGKQLGRFGHVEAPLRLFSKHIGDACEPFTSAMEREIAGRIVMVARGQCSFAEKALNVQAAGGRGVIIINKKNARATADAEPPRYVITDDDRGDGARVHIPLVMMSRSVALELHRAVRWKLELIDGPGEASIDDTASTSMEDDVVVSLSAWLY